MRHTRMMLVAAIALIVVPFAWSSGAAESAPGGRHRTRVLDPHRRRDVRAVDRRVRGGESRRLDHIGVEPLERLLDEASAVAAGGEGPDIFYQHIAFLENSIPHAAPYDPELMPYDELAATFDLVEENMIDGEVYYLPLATMTGSIFYNRDILSEVGVARVPETWDEFIALAQELTVTDDSGVVTRAGFSFNGMQRELNWALGYQMGLPIFDAAGRSTIASEKAQETLAYLVNLYEEEGIGSMLMSGNAWDQFANGRAAMVYVYGWVYGWMAENAPGVDFGVAPLPSFDGTPPRLRPQQPRTDDRRESLHRRRQGRRGTAFHRLHPRQRVLPDRLRCAQGGDSNALRPPVGANHHKPSALLCRAADD
jgi:hypothetical protein